MKRLVHATLRLEDTRLILVTGLTASFSIVLFFVYGNMMTLSRFRHLAILCTFCCLVQANSFGNEVFISFSSIGDAPARTNVERTLRRGETIDAFVWIEATSDIDTLAVTDVLLSNAETGALTVANVFNADINATSDGTTTFSRWEDTGNGVVSATGDAISGLFGFSGVVGAGPTIATGIRLDQDGSGAFVDTLFDNSADAFLFAQVEFIAVERGTVNINPNGIFLNGGQLQNFDVFGATITVVPEPLSGTGLLFGLLVLAGYRKRN